MNKYFVVSDIHDHYTELMHALKEKEFDLNGSDKLIVCGDAFTRGDETGNVYDLLKRLAADNRLIYILGNHDIELVKGINEKKLSNGNRRCLRNLIQHLADEDVEDSGLANHPLALQLRNFITGNAVPYYETEHYIFVHGYIPVKNKSYNPNWRNSSVREFNASAIGDGMKLALLYRIKEDGKTIVFGHYSAARARLMSTASQSDWNNKIYKNISGLVKKDPHRWAVTFTGDGFIALDASVYHTGFINCITVED